MAKYVVKGGKTYVMNRSGTAPMRVSDDRYLLREQLKEEERLAKKKEREDARKTPEELDEDEVEYQDYLENVKQDEDNIPLYVKKHNKFEDLRAHFAGNVKKVVSKADGLKKDIAIVDVEEPKQEETC
jgi:hypothetical protein